MITKPDIVRMLQSFQYLPNSPIKDDTKRLATMADTYYEALKDLPLEMLKAAASAYLATGQFFPTPGNVRERAVDIALLSMGVPTAGEAWGQVMNGKGILHSVRCPAGETLRLAVDGKIGREYWLALENYSAHVDNCVDCYDDRSDGWHPTVKAAFDSMGGDRGVFTDNMSADRARFMDQYRAFVEREVLRFSMPANVRGYIEETKQQLATGQVRELADKMSNPRLMHPGTGERLE